jgi:hypothetical protein
MRKLALGLAAALLAIAFMAVAGTAGAQNGHEPPQQEPADTCSDTHDNDQDGHTDGDDTECQDPHDGVEDGSDEPSPPPPDCGPGAEPGEDGQCRETDCADGHDNDQDGLTDGDDPDCDGADGQLVCHPSDSVLVHAFVGGQTGQPGAICVMLGDQDISNCPPTYTTTPEEGEGTTFERAFEFPPAEGEPPNETGTVILCVYQEAEPPEDGEEPPQE